MEIQHPETEKLAHYLESPEAGTHQDIRRHLAGCQNCRLRLDKLARLETGIKTHAAAILHSNTTSEDESRLIEQFVDNQLDAAKAQQVRSELQDRPAALKSALHYAVHSSSMARNMNNPAPESVAHRHWASKLIHLLLVQSRAVFQWPIPAWSLAPASLAIGALISIFIVLGQQDYPEGIIATYQDNTSMVFKRDGLPSGSIGFFHDAQSRSEEYSGIEINIIDKQLNISWPEVNNAVSYTVTVNEISGHRITELARHETDESHTAFSGLKLKHQERYQWILGGKTGDGFQFETTGNFIYINREKSERDQ